jgi:hypothetical protein
MDEDSTLRSKEKKKEAAIYGPAIRRLLHCGSSWVRVVAVHPPLCHDLSNAKVRIVTIAIWNFLINRQLVLLVYVRLY